MNHAQDNAIELSNRTPKDQRRVQLGFAFLTVLVLVSSQVFIGLEGNKYGMPWEWPWLELAARLRPDSVVEWLFILFIVPAIQLGRRVDTQRIVISKEGLRFSSQLPRWAKVFQPDWSYPWEEITLRPWRDRIDMPTQAILVIESERKRHRVPLLGWYPADAASQATIRTASNDFFTFKTLRKATDDALASSPLLNALKAHGVTLDPAKPVVDDLARSGGGIALAGVTIGGLMYAVGDLLFQGEEYLDATPWPWVILAGVVAACAAVVITWRSRLNLAERLILPLLVGGAISFAAVPGILRLNALTASTPSRPVVFEQQPDLSLVPVSAPGVPAFRPDRYDWYWLGFDAGHMHTLKVRKGGLGLWTYDLADLRDQMRNREER